MSRENQQNNGLFRTATHLGLLSVLAASFTGACVSSGNGNSATGGAISLGGTGEGTGGATGVGGATESMGGNTSAGGATHTGGSSLTCTAASYADCNLTTGVVTGNACAPNPLIFALDANCTTGLWASDYTSSGYFYQPWCNSPTISDCNLKMTCAANSMHVTGSYIGSGGAEAVDGNGGWGGNLQTTYPDAGPGCQMISGTALTGLTLDINVATLPTGNHMYIGINLANGNSATYTATLAVGAQTVKIPWACFKNEKACGSVPGPGITNFYFTFDWFNDLGATHNVDVTISNLGFY